MSNSPAWTVSGVQYKIGSPPAYTRDVSNYPNVLQKSKMPLLCVCLLKQSRITGQFCVARSTTTWDDCQSSALFVAFSSSHAKGEKNNFLVEHNFLATPFSTADTNTTFAVIWNFCVVYRGCSGSSISGNPFQDFMSNMYDIGYFEVVNQFFCDCTSIHITTRG